MWLSIALAFAGDPILLRDARLWDGTGAPVRTTDILLHDDHVEAVGVDLGVPANAEVVELAGRTVLPGLIDSHVHVSSVPGAFLRGDDRTAQWRHVRHQLRAYLANGVTTVLDCAIPHHVAEATWSWMDAGHPGPELLVLGIPLSPPDGYIRTILDVAPTFGTPAAVSDHLDELVELGAIGTKLPIEEGFVSRIWPLHTDAMHAVIRREAEARALPIYVHAMSNREYNLALDLDVHAMVHPVQHPRRRTVQRLVEQDTWVVSTISIADMFSVPHDPDYLSAPHVVRSVPAEVLATATDPELRESYKPLILDIMTPKLPGFLRGLAGDLLDKPSAVDKRVGVQVDAVRKMHEAGVSVVMGSDAGNWPQLPYSFHGPISIRELQLLSRAGFTPEEALLAATAMPARMLGKEDEIGRVLPGMRADLLILDADPLADLSALTEVAYVVRAGEMRTPDAWMIEPDIPAPDPILPDWITESP